LIDFDEKILKEIWSIERTFDTDDPRVTLEENNDVDCSLAFERSNQPYWNAVLTTKYHNPDYKTSRVFVFENGNYEQPGVLGIILRGGCITAVVPGSPAKSSGLKVNDGVVAVDGILTRFRSNDQIAEMLRGAPASNVIMEISRKGIVHKVVCKRIAHNKIKFPEQKQNKKGVRVA